MREFLDALHAFDSTGLPVERPDWVETYTRHCDEFRRLVVPLLRRELHAPAEALFTEVETLVGFEPAFTHSDLGPEHLLCRDGRLIGVIDWGDARVGDPAIDYAWLLNGPFPDWDVDDELRRRARFYCRLAPWFEGHYSVFTKQPARLPGALRGIEERL
jgi:aminoglycoside phosphotransferase (APT) family kinase protein